MIENNGELKKFVCVALGCGIVYAMFGPVGLACIALAALCWTARKK